MLSALVSVVLFACRPAVDVSSGGSGGSPSSGGSVSSSSSSSTSSSGDESSTGEPQFEGPGCGEPPPCDRGTFEGHMRIESAEDLAQIEGFTEITGALEIMNSQDLVCLDALACLEVGGRDVRIQDNAALRSTGGLGALREIGQESGGGLNASGDIIVAHNAVLERLAGFAVQEVYRSVLLLENPQLRVVSGLRELRTVAGLHVTSNPRLESMVGLRDVVAVWLCYVSFNESLCADEVVAVCGGLESPPKGAAVYNDPGCGSVPAGTFDEWYEGVECFVGADDCPLGQKCTAVSAEGYPNPTHLACRPVVEEPDAPYEACSVLGEQGAGLDTCERHSYCWYGECVPMCRGYHPSGACLSTEARCRVNSSGTLLLCEAVCDPILQNCDEGLGCYPVDGAYQCAPVASERGAGNSGEDCGFINECDAGLTCVNPDVRSDCSAEAGGCCTELCDVRERDCPPGLDCVPWYERFPPFPTNLPRHLENVGICVDPS